MYKIVLAIGKNIWENLIKIYEARMRVFDFAALSFFTIMSLLNLPEYI